jgi:hypothetical protein
MSAPGSPHGSVYLIAGTTDGVHVFRSGLERAEWRRVGHGLEGLDVSHAILDDRRAPLLYAAATGNGATGIWRSLDCGASWSPLQVPFDGADQVWHVAPAGEGQPNRLYAGVRPAGIYRSDDGGATWLPLDGMNEHPTRAEWWEGGAGGVYLHTILVDPAHEGRLYAGISVAGMFRSDDHGATWRVMNEGVYSFAEDEPEFPQVHRCVHKAVLHPHDPSVLYQQNHMGVYRSDDGGESWVDISGGLPERFGFPIAITSEATPAVFMVPQNENEIRYSGQLTVYRTRDGGATWEPLTNGLPETERHTLYREGLMADGLAPAAVYFGTSDGVIWYSRDGGDSWQALARDLPPVRSVTCAVLP